MNGKTGAIAIAAVGGIFLFSGVSGASITGSIRDIISGKTPAKGADPITGTVGSGTTGTEAESISGGSLASLALSDVGMPYVWGGANPPIGADCSGMVNGDCRKLGLAIPGSPTGQYSGHGPVTSQWFVTNVCTTVSESDAQAGDLVCWLTHMGVYVGGGEMVSALNPRLGTLKTTIASAAPPGEPMRIRRHK